MMNEFHMWDIMAVQYITVNPEVLVHCYAFSWLCM